MSKKRLAVLGARSLVGHYLLPLLDQANYDITAFSRRDSSKHDTVNELCITRKKIDLSLSKMDSASESIETWICLAPIWILSEYYSFFQHYGVKRIIALSSTSRLSKQNSSDKQEQALSDQMKNGEDQLRLWAERNGIEWVILRPTLIYGCGLDKNISEIARFIRRFKFFPLFGKAMGLRQPIFAADVAKASLAAAQCEKVGTYNISGAEILSYREMVQRIFIMLGYKPRLLNVPLWFFTLTVAILRLFPRYRKWTSAMAVRMNQDLVFDHSPAINDLGFNPQSFRLRSDDYSKQILT